MSILVILLPARARLGPSAAGEAATPAPQEFIYALSPDGLSVSAQGQATPALLPKADSVVAVLNDRDVSWHRITFPRAPAARLRSALVGLLEEQLLDEEDAVHLAVAPEAAAGRPTWVAAMHKPWLVSQLATLEKTGAFVERVVPSSWPSEAAMGHFHTSTDDSDGSTAQVWLARSDEAGVHCLRLAGGLPRAAQAQWSAQSARWSATPAVAAQAERWLGAPVMVLTEAERALASVRSLWNLRQFDLAPRNRGSRALRDLTRRLRQPAWRPARLGLVALLAVQVVGLNLWAWHQRRSIADKREAMVEILKTSHPQVRAVLDAPLQMRRETDALRAAAGRTGEGDLEALLGVTARAWPDGRPPVDSLRFEPGRLTVPAAGWTPQQIDALRARLQPAGLAVESAEGRLTITRAAPAKGAAS